MKQIPLSEYGKNKGKYFALVDDEDYEFLMQWKWQTRKDRSGNVYVQRQSVASNKKQSTITMHSAIIKKHEKVKVLRGFIFDHADHNGLNNQKYNIRKCTRHQNNCNKKKYRISNATSRYKGVCKSGKKWRVLITVNNKKICVGTFLTQVDAALAYNKAAIKHHGEFAFLNKIYCNPCVVDSNNLIQKYHAKSF